MSAFGPEGYASLCQLSLLVQSVPACVRPPGASLLRFKLPDENYYRDSSAKWNAFHTAKEGQTCAEGEILSVLERHLVFRCVPSRWLLLRAQQYA